MYLFFLINLDIKAKIQLENDFTSKKKKNKKKEKRKKIDGNKIYSVGCRLVDNENLAGNTKFSLALSLSLSKPYQLRKTFPSLIHHHYEYQFTLKSH